MTTAAGNHVLYVALELGQDKWHLAFATQAAEKPRFRAIPARDLGRLADEIHKAKERFRLPGDAPVRTCYEAGRDGFWVHRALVARGIDNLVVDSSAIEVNRRRKRGKSDPVGAAKALHLLWRDHAGGEQGWRGGRVPAVADEDRRQLHRGLKVLQRQQTECSNRIQGLLASYGLTAVVNARFRDTLAELRDWAGQPVPAGLQRRLLQEFAVWEAVHAQVCEAGNEQERGARAGVGPHFGQARGPDGVEAGGGGAAAGVVGGGVGGAGQRKGEGTGGRGGAAAHAVPERAVGAGARDQQGGQQARPRADRGGGLAVAAVAAGE